MLKRFLIAGLLLFCGAEAFAAVNVRQNGDGTADYVGARDTARFGNCVGGEPIQIPVQLNTLSTGYGVSVSTNSIIRGVYSVTPTTTTGTATIRVYVNQVTTPVRFFSTTTGLATHATLGFRGAAAGTVSRISRLNEVTGALSVIDNAVQEGDYIAVGSDGGATGLATAQVFVQVCPR